jgi:hypothetical protein
MTGYDFAKSQADLRRNGLQEWGHNPSRIGKLKSSAVFEIYTPGSSAAKQISILILLMLLMKACSTILIT